MTRSIFERKAVLNHEPNPYRYHTFGATSRIARTSVPSPTIMAIGCDSPLIARDFINQCTRFADMLTQELPESAPSSCGLRLASFFCGAGGFDLGFRSAGFELAFANDYSEEAAVTFERNLKHKPRVADVRTVASSDVPSVDVLTGGFPCVTFSTAGSRAGVDDDLNGKLYLELCRLIRDVRPRYFIAENVRGMLSANGGNAIKLVLAAFLRLGYRTSLQLVNMAEHGVPQARWRVIFVGVRLDEWRGEFKFPRPTHRLHDDKKAARWLPCAVSLAEALGGLPAPDAALMNHQPNDKPVSSDRPAPTIVSKTRNPFIDTVMRRMTIRECARVQTFPDWFEFYGNDDAGYRQTGNAVPPLYAKRLAFAVREYDARPKLDRRQRP